MSRSASKTILILASVIYGPATIPCAIASLMTSMVADANPPAWIFSLILIGSLAVPVSMLFSVILGWVFYRKQRYGTAELLPLVPFLVSLIPFAGIVLLSVID